MSTRSLTVFVDEDGAEFAVLYRHSDGYPKGHGKELATLLAQKVIVNGYALSESRDIANGMANLAVQIIASLAKDDLRDSRRLVRQINKRHPSMASPLPHDLIGQYYLYPAGHRQWDIEYIYTVYPVKMDDKEEWLPYLKIQETSVGGTMSEPTLELDDVLFDGPVTGAILWLRSNE